MRLLENDGTQLLFEVERLWEHDEFDWFRRIALSGGPVKAVRKVLRDGRGRMLVELMRPVPEAEALVIEAVKWTSGEPSEDHIYRVKKTFRARSLAKTFDAELPELEKGILFKEVEKLSSGGWVFLVLTGKHVGTSILFSPSEWESALKSIEDLGTEISAKQGVPDEDPEGADSLGTPGKDVVSKGPVPGLVPAKRKSGKHGGFPPFPVRQPLSSYRSKKTSKKKPPAKKVD